jgi:hypothetical protein
VRQKFQTELNTIESARLSRIPVRYNRGEKDWAIELRGKVQLLDDQYQELGKKFEKIAREDHYHIRKFVMENYTLPALRAAGLDSFAPELWGGYDRMDSLHNDTLVQFSPGCAKCYVFFRICPFGLVGEIEFTDESRNFYARITPKYRTEGVEDYLFHSYEVSTSCLRFSPGDGNLVSLLQSILNKADSLNHMMPNAYGLKYIHGELTRENVKEDIDEYLERQERRKKELEEQSL